MENLNYPFEYLLKSQKMVQEAIDKMLDNNKPALGSDYTKKELSQPLEKIKSGIVSMTPLKVWCSDCGGIRNGNTLTVGETCEIFCQDCSTTIEEIN